MIRSLLASKTTKLVAACVCPVAGTGALTVAVPQVRQAVHKATAPRAYAAPKTRVRPAAAPCIETPAPIAQVLQPPLALVAPREVAPTPDTTTERTPELATNNPITNRPPDVPIIGIQNPDVPAVPEPASWAQMIAGFGLIGGAIRLRNRAARSVTNA